MTALAPTESLAPAVAAARLTAKRAYHFAAELGSLADATEAAAQRPADARAAGRLEAERGEAVAAGERLAASMRPTADQGALAATPLTQVRWLVEVMVSAEQLRAWAARWDAFAARVDP